MNKKILRPVYAVRWKISGYWKYRTQMKLDIGSVAPLAYYHFMPFGDSRIYHFLVSFEAKNSLDEVKLRLISL